MTDLCNSESNGAAPAPSGARMRWWDGIVGGRIYDGLMRMPVVIWFTFLALSYAHELGASLRQTGLFELDALHVARLLSRVTMLLFVVMIAGLTMLRSRPVTRARGLQPRISALLGTYLVYGIVFLDERHNLPASWHFVSAGLVITGYVLAVMALRHLGRSFSIMPEARRLVTDGPYRWVRHPLYLAEQVAIVGALIQFWSPAAALLLVTQFSFQVVRMLNEEAVLSQSFTDYSHYMKQTSRLVPGVW